MIAMRAMRAMRAMLLQATFWSIRWCLWALSSMKTMSTYVLFGEDTSCVLPIQQIELGLDPGSGVCKHVSVLTYIRVPLIGPIASFVKEMLIMWRGGSPLTWKRCKKQYDKNTDMCLYVLRDYTFRGTRFSELSRGTADILTKRAAASICNNSNNKLFATLNDSIDCTTFVQCYRRALLPEDQGGQGVKLSEFVVLMHLMGCLSSAKFLRSAVAGRDTEPQCKLGVISLSDLREWEFGSLGHKIEI